MLALRALGALARSATGVPTRRLGAAPHCSRRASYSLSIPGAEGALRCGLDVRA